MIKTLQRALNLALDTLEVKQREFDRMYMSHEDYKSHIVIISDLIASAEKDKRKKGETMLYEMTMNRCE